MGTKSKNAGPLNEKEKNEFDNAKCAIGKFAYIALVLASDSNYQS
jgi:hypothetical protein